MEKLVEIKRGQTGTGLLIEHDGYVQLNEDNRRQLKESLEGSTDYCPEHFIVSAVFQKYGIENANGRIYPENVLRREVEKYMTKIKEHRAIGELNHPSESVIDLSRVAMNIIDLRWQGHTLVGELEILTSPGFRKSGVISCQGDQAANLLLSGIKIGVSSRGLGSVTNKFGTLYVGDDYEIVCWDIVSDPSTPNAWITKQGEIPSIYVENKNENKKSLIDEKINKANEILSNF